MGTKVEVNGKKEMYTYPLLMISSEERIVWMLSESEGVIIKGKLNSIQTGKYCTGWIMDEFKPFTGSITLSNNDSITLGNE